MLKDADLIVLFVPSLFVGQEDWVASGNTKGLHSYVNGPNLKGPI